MDLRAGPPAVEGRTRSRSLRGPVLAGPASSCAHDNDCICLPPISPPQNSKAGKKESTAHHLNRPCPPYDRPSSTSSLGHHRNDARTAENGFATSNAVSKSAKVVLVLVRDRQLLRREQCDHAAAFVGHDHFLLDARRRIAVLGWAIGLQREYHALLDLGWVVNRDHARDDWTLVQCQAKPVAELQAEGGHFIGEAEFLRL